jgi:ParB family transcriptional regulator, chromosome partitioning protein
MTSAKRPLGLGRGLSALMGELAPATPVASADTNRLAIDLIDANPKQPRRQFDDAALSELTASIRDRGVIQPLLVRPKSNGRYELVAGERRWRAAQRAHLHEVPVVIRPLDDSATLEIALVENIQRQDLNPIEEAEAYQRLVEDYGHAMGAIADLVGKSRPYVANLVRLLDLPAEVRTLVMSGELSQGHARALITTDDPAGLARQVIAKGLSVRETERLAAGAKDKPTRSRLEIKSAAPKDPDTRALEQDLSNAVGLSVTIDDAGGRGTVTIHYRDLDQLDALCARLSGRTTF